MLLVNNGQGRMINAMGSCTKSSMGSFMVNGNLDWKFNKNFDGLGGISSLSKDSIFSFPHFMNFDDYYLLPICFLISFLYPQIHFDW